MTKPVTDTRRLFDPYKIFLYALEHALVKDELVQEVASQFGVDYTTVRKWGSINETTRRRNPIGAILTLYKIFWLNCRPAAFQIQSAIKEMEMSLQANLHHELPAFNSHELIGELLKAAQTAVNLQSRNSPPGAYLELLSEVQNIGSAFSDRVTVPSPPTQPQHGPRKMAYDPRTPQAYK